MSGLSGLPWRLSLARALAWALLLAGWVGLGSVAIVLAPGIAASFGAVALWLLALGLAATVATRDALRAGHRRVALAAAAITAAAAIVATTRGGGLAALGIALVAWAALTALASGVVRSLRFARPGRPAPPVGAAALGAAAAALALADPADLQGLTLRLGAVALAAAVLLAALQPPDPAGGAASGCRAGLFDCSLPAWPAGAWSDLRQWPTLLAGLAMLPMMAALPLMADWCRAQAVAPQAMVGLHFAAMFVPAVAARRSIARWSARRLAATCAAGLAAGAVAVVAAPPPWDLLGLALTHGMAWGLAWAGQLWAPDRRGRAGASPLRAAVGYAALTLAFGVVIARYGAAGVGGAQAALGLAAAAAWLAGAVAEVRDALAARADNRAAAAPDRPAARNRTWT
jgi:hypothetical protein